MFYAFFPQFIGYNPIRETLNRWDELLSHGRPIVAIGGSDAHAMHRYGPVASRHLSLPQSSRFKKA
ncbi:MAG: hypothetical protein U0X87_03490 [Anaerolineales bacterium]